MISIISFLSFVIFSLFNIKLFLYIICKQKNVSKATNLYIICVLSASRIEKLLFQKKI